MASKRSARRRQAADLKRSVRGSADALAVTPAITRGGVGFTWHAIERVRDRYPYYRRRKITDADIAEMCARSLLNGTLVYEERFTAGDRRSYILGTIPRRQNIEYVVCSVSGTVVTVLSDTDSREPWYRDKVDN